MASSSNMQVKMADTTQPEKGRKDHDQYWRYLPLLKAALRGEWETAKSFFDQDEAALTARITEYGETALHVAIGAGRGGNNKANIHFVENLVELMPVEALALPAFDISTALHRAAHFGNTKAAVLLAEKNPYLLYIRNRANDLPVGTAARDGRKDTLSYLLTVTKEDNPFESTPFAGQSGVKLLTHIIFSGFYDVALNLVHHYPQLAKQVQEDGLTALQALAGDKSAFPSGTRLSYWQRLIYSYVPVKLENYSTDHNRDDIENSVNNSQVIVQKYDWAPFFEKNFSISVSQGLQAMLWKAFELLVPNVKHIQEQKLMHLQALQLLKFLCMEIRSLNDLNAYKLFAKDAVFLAARHGIHEVVEEIVDSFPSLVWARDSNNLDIFQLAVIHRQENVFNLVYQMSDHKELFLTIVDNDRNTILHFAGRLAPPDKLNLVSGEALQMQRELQWFKEVEKFGHRTFQSWQNRFNETPAMVFSKEHKQLVVQGEKWMKDTANSCTIAAALIATVVFAAAITVPGGNEGASGLPIFSKEKAFIVFAVSDAISLFTSTTSLLMFLSILTSRYAESDFLYVLPKRLIIGLLTLFLSITSMMVAFSTTLYLVFSHKKAWILLPVAALACLPVSSFVSLQFPLLVDLFCSTYGPGIFGKKSDRPFY